MNPFYLKALPDTIPLCDREQELRFLTDTATSKNDVVIYAPRRFGKTTLVRRVQKELARQGAITIYVNFFGVGSVHHVATSLAAAVYRVTHNNEALWKKALRFLTSVRPVMRPTPDGFEISAETTTSQATGLELLDRVLTELERFIVASDHLVHIAFDEFQEIVILDETTQIEAVMRTRIESYAASHFFIGSRRRLLLSIFNERQRPFFQSALIYPLGPLPDKILTTYIINRFSETGSSCTMDAAQEIARLTQCHPYYSQKLAFLVFDEAKDVTYEVIDRVFGRLLDSEEAVFEAMMQKIPPQQRLLLYALTREATDQPTSSNYIRKHLLGSVTGIKHSLQQLDQLDYIEHDKGNNAWHLVDPIFATWLRQRN